jgi:hypothetical protein
MNLRTACNQIRLSVPSSAIVFAALCGAADNASALELEYKTDRRGNDYTVFNLKDADPSPCEQRCAAEDQCMAFTYVKPGVQGPSPRCWLKSRVPPPKTDDCCVSGFKLSNYMQDCKKAGVPLPPVWGDAGWQRKGVLPKKLSFDGDYATTEVWTYATDAGICYALPRIDDSGVIKLLGIICQGQKVSKEGKKVSTACFWDNVDAATGKRIEGAATAGMDPRKIGDGYTLKLPESEQCTHCHRGDNVFTIYPGTVLAQGDKTNVTDAYTPIVQGGWALNPRRNYKLRADKYPKSDGSAKTDGCVTCHSLPQLSVGYCNVLQRVLETTPVLDKPTMPPTAIMRPTAIMPPENDPMNDTMPEYYWYYYGEDITVLASECKKIGFNFTFSKADFEKLWGPQSSPPP